MSFAKSLSSTNCLLRMTKMEWSAKLVEALPDPSAGSILRQAYPITRSCHPEPVEGLLHHEPIEGLFYS